MDETVSGELQTGADVLAVLELLELCSGLGLGDLLARDLASGNLLDGVNGSLGGLCDALCGSSDGGVEETGVGVDGAGGLDLDAGGSCVSEDGEARRPLDGRLATEQRAEDSELGLVELAGERAGAGEGNDHGVAAVVGNALLTTNVLGLLSANSQLLLGLGRDAVEELVHPLGELAVLGTVGDDCEVGLGVCALGEPLDGGSVEVLGVGRLRGRGGGVSEAAVEGEAVGRVGGHVSDAGEEALVGEVDEREDLLGVDVGWSVLASSHTCTLDNRELLLKRTLVLGLANHLAEQLDKVGQVIAQELCLEDEVLARVVCVEGSSQELGFADNAQGGPPLGGLEWHWPSVALIHNTQQQMSLSTPVSSLGVPGMRSWRGPRSGRAAAGIAYLPWPPVRVSW